MRRMIKDTDLEYIDSIKDHITASKVELVGGSSKVKANSIEANTITNKSYNTVQVIEVDETFYNEDSQLYKVDIETTHGDIWVKQTGQLLHEGADIEFTFTEYEDYKVMIILGKHLNAAEKLDGGEWGLSGTERYNSFIDFLWEENDEFSIHVDGRIVFIDLGKCEV